LLRFDLDAVAKQGRAAKSRQPAQVNPALIVTDARQHTPPEALAPRLKLTLDQPESAMFHSVK